MYSGGIDSSAIICSLLAACNKTDLREFVVVGLSETSIKENPSLYKNYIVKNFERVSSNRFNYYIGHPDYIIVNGEGNDQLFGSDLIHGLTHRFGSNILNTKRSDGVIYDCFNNGDIPTTVCNKFLEIFNKATAAAPIPIETVFHYFWWINFHFKWQNVYLRMLPNIQQDNVKVIPNDNYFSFFQTDKFQLWTLNNTDRLVKDTWKSYKYVAKEFIYSVNPDPEYRDRKAKFGSLGQVTRYKQTAQSIDENFNLSRELVNPAYWDERNDFV
jgi:hypothetical protein